MQTWQAENILLNVVVFADYQLESEPNKTVIGVDARGRSLVLEPNGEFSETDQRVLITIVSTCSLLTYQEYR